MSKEKNQKSISFIRVVIIGVLFAVMMNFGIRAEAKSCVRLSYQKRTVREGQTFVLTLKGVPSKIKSNKIKWKISDSDVAGIKKKSHNKAKIKVWEDGNTTVTAIYKGKKYNCQS